MGSLWGWRAPFFICAIPGLVVAALYGIFGREPERGSSDHLKPTQARATFRGLFTNAAFLTATFGLAALTFTMGGISSWVPEFLRRNVGLSVSGSSQMAGLSTVVDGILGTLIGGWIASAGSRTNHRALYLLSFWSVALTIPFGALLFFGPPRWAIPALFVAEFFLFLNTGPLNTAIMNSVSATSAPPPSASTSSSSTASETPSPRKSSEPSATAPTSALAWAQPSSPSSSPVSSCSPEPASLHASKSRIPPEYNSNIFCS